jgi:hypothetical protein
MAENSGYFLSVDQKFQLFKYGYVQDQNSQWYNVYIVPGIHAPYYRVSGQYKKSFHSLSSYTNKMYYNRGYNFSRKVSDFSYNKIWKEFTLNGSKNAWKNSFEKASLAHEKKTFGWWLAYPWALLSSSVDNVVRIPLGTLGMGSTFLVAFPVSPIVFVGYPVVESSYYFLEGSGYFISSVGWHVTIFPPLAIFAKKPSLSRVDGYWVRLVDSPNMMLLPDKKLEEIVDWGVFMNNKLNWITEEKLLVVSQHNNRLKKLRAALKEENRLFDLELSQLNLKEKKSVSNLSTKYVTNQVTKNLDFDKFPDYQFDTNKVYIRDIMNKRKFSQSEQVKLLELIKKYPKPFNLTENDNKHEKTDPVQNSSEVINNVGKDFGSIIEND